MLTVNSAVSVNEAGSFMVTVDAQVIVMVTVFVMVVNPSAIIV